jgi:cytochrome o ubiquinol oxidase operon protein cyoD
MSRVVISQHEGEQRKLASYISGFVLSLIFTLSAYIITVSHVFNLWAVVVIISILAFAQFVVQMVLFLHLGSEQRPRWKLMVFGMMATIVIIIVAGSLWIMTALNGRMMPSTHQQEKYMKSQQGI